MLSREIDPSIEDEDHDLRILFRRALAEFKQTSIDKKGNRYFTLLWSEVAPQGNIYRRNAVYAEHRLHSEDLWIQLREIADKYKAILGGDTVSTEDRADRLYEALKQTKVMISLDEEEPPEEFIGYMPLEEFLKDKVTRHGPIVFQADMGMRAEEMKHRIISLNVFLLQVIAPFLIFLNRWDMDTNHIKDLWVKGYRSSRFQTRELLCLGTDFATVLTTILGVQLLFAVIFIARCYVDQQFANHSKIRLLPVAQVWFFMDMFANAWCVVFIVLCMPLLFWSEDTPTNIVLDSMTLIFLFKLDDLSEVLCSYVGMTDADFERLCAWATAFTSACPLNVERLINPKAESVETIWSINFDQKGNLLGVDGRPCRTRLQHLHPEQKKLGRALTERTPLRRQGTLALPAAVEVIQGNIESAPLVYHRNREHEQVIPTPMMEASLLVWTLMSYFIYTANIVVPIGWYVFNKPCFYTE